jgi:hypothetical protein
LVAVLMMKCVPPVSRETRWPQRLSLMVQSSCVSLVKKPRIRPTSTARRTFAV